MTTRAPWSRRKWYGFALLACVLIALGLWTLITGQNPSMGTGVDGIRTGIFRGWGARLMGLVICAAGAVVLRETLIREKK